jgi:hypothetical protein
MKTTMKSLYGCGIAFVFLFILMDTLHAQGHFPTPSYTPRFTPVFHSPNYSYTYGTVSLRHKFKIVFKDGTDTIVTTKMHADTPAYYLPLENKSVRKKDSARYRKLYPSETQYIVRMGSDSLNSDRYVVTESRGMASDSCWLFKAIDGKISAYTALAEDDVDDGFLLYIQKDNGPLVPLNEQNMEDMVSTNEKATRQAKKKNYTKAIKTYNKSAQ